jgi:hypothetical protein
MSRTAASAVDNLRFGTHPADPTGGRDYAGCSGNGVHTGQPCPPAAA